jgi:hypothetical protein
MIRRSLAVLSVVAAASSTTFIASPSPVSATGVGVVCTSARASDPFFSVSGCSGNTGGSGGAYPWAVPGQPIALQWANGKTTTLSPMKVTQVTTDERERATHACISNGAWYEEIFSGTVIADTTGSIKVGGAVTGEMCFDFADRLWDNEPFAKFKIV